MRLLGSDAASDQLAAKKERRREFDSSWVCNWAIVTPTVVGEKEVWTIKWLSLLILTSTANTIQYSEDRWYAVRYYLILICIWRYLDLCVYVGSGKEMDCNWVATENRRVISSTHVGKNQVKEAKLRRQGSLKQQQT
jgi:hypothetical protein